MDDKFNTINFIIEKAVGKAIDHHELSCPVASNWKNYKKLVDDLLAEREQKRGNIVISHKQFGFIISSIIGVFTILYYILSCYNALPF